MSTPDLVGLIETYISAWNERDEVRRLELLTQVLEPDAEVVDPFDDEPAVGPAGVSRSIDKAFRERIPDGARFVMRTEPEHHNGAFRYVFALVGPNDEVLREGLDTGRVSARGRVSLILTFLPPTPAGL